MEVVKELNDKNYTQFIEVTNSVIFIDFYSETCGPCQTLLTFLPKLIEYYKDENVIIAKVNINSNPKLSKKFMVQSVPLTVIIDKDKMVKHAEIGLMSIDSYIKMIDKTVGKGGFFSKFFG